MPDPLDPQKFHIIPSQTAKKLSIAVFVFLVFILPLGLFQYYKIAVYRPSPLDREIAFEIKSGEGVSQIASNLYQQGAVNSEFLFAFYVFINKLDRNIQAGVYTIKAGSNVSELAEQFQHGVNDNKVTFLEGWRVEEFALAANNEFDKIDYSEFVRKAAQYEGYLFPDTYYFEKNIQEDEMIAKLRETFDAKTKDLLSAQNLTKVGLTKDQVVTLASIVEREVSDPKDRKLVAGVLLNRHRTGVALGADATTQYAIAKVYLCGSENLLADSCAPTIEELTNFNWWRNEITQEDLDYDSPFNTRKVAGFPPHPISNPSLSAIEAVVNYEESSYHYYLTDNFGNTHYAVTLDEHNANVLEFLR